jgi:hypothetical protein
MTTTGKNRIMIFGPKTDGTYVVEFRTPKAMAISIPRTETAVIRHFQERMPRADYQPAQPAPHPGLRGPAKHFVRLIWTGQGYPPDGQSRVSRCRFASE